MTIQEAADKANVIYAAHEEGADMDAGFDAGEFSGPAHSRIAEREVRLLCSANCVDYDEVQYELVRRSHEE